MADAKKLIEQNLQSKDPYLDLGNCGLNGTEDYLSLLAECTHLETLIFSNEWNEHNFYNDTWEEIISKNKGKVNVLKYLPKSLPKGLKKIVIQGKLNNKWRIKNIDILESLQGLEELHFANNISRKYAFLSSLKKLKLIDLGGNHVKVNFIKVLKDLEQIQILFLNNNKIEDITPLSNLKELKVLYLASNQIQNIDTISSLKKLKKLILSGNQIKTLHPISLLINLQTLSLFNNQIQDLSPLSSLINLQELDLSGNQIQDLSPLSKLTELKLLFLIKNKIKDLGHLKDLKELQELDFSENQVQDIDVLQHLTNLQSLVFSLNQVQDIDALQQLTNLQSLVFASNQVQDISGIKDLTNLQKLVFASNQVQDIDALQQLTNLQSLVFFSNPFLEKLPEEIRNKDWKEVLQVWLDTYGKTVEVAKPIREAKVVFVGEGGSGKTSLMHLLLYGKKEQTTRTEKIEIHTDTENFTYGENQEKLTLRFWDFGGQDIMHATHKFFMSNRTLYVLISNGRKNEDDELKNWIEMLKTAIGDSPVLLVANWLDNPKKSHKIPDLELKRQFPNLILPVIETSWETGRGLEDLKNAIQDALQNMPHFEEPFSALYQSTKEKLLNIKRPYIDYREYEDICQEVGNEKESEFNETSQKVLADFLNDLGIMLNFQKANDRLEDLFIFKPAWIVEGVYRIINSEEAEKQKGKIKEETISKLLREINYRDARERNFIIDMMKHFKLAFEYSQRKTYYLIPSLFDKNRPESIDKNRPKENLLRVRVEYEIWRNDYISYFLVNEHQQIAGADYWINGAILNYGEQKVFIEAIRSKKSMQIEVSGGKDKRYAFWRVREALTQVHEMFDVEKLGISLWVVYEENGKIDEFEYEFLKNAQEDGVLQIYSSKLRKMLDVNQLLGEISLSKSEIPEVIKKALWNLEQANISSYFEEMDKLDLPKNLRFDYSRLKNQFIDGKFNNEISQRLRTFAQEIANLL